MSHGQLRHERGGLDLFGRGGALAARGEVPSDLCTEAEGEANVEIEISNGPVRRLEVLMRDPEMSVWDLTLQKVASLAEFPSDTDHGRRLFDRRIDRVLVDATVSYGIRESGATGQGQAQHPPI